ncbi:MAG: acyl-CoA dehydrogenase [Myxococcales bacterium]|nr:acyl-CoA dehydrogenase [Myxococcales bacterium]
MQIYNPPLKEIRFLLEAFGYDEQVATLDGFKDFDLDTVMTLMEQSGRFCAEQMLPLNRVGDQVGLDYDPDNYTVTMPKGFKELYQMSREQGGMGLTAPADYGGFGAPQTAGMILSEMATATNKSYSMCAGLTHGLIDALASHGTEEQKQTFLPKLASGEWSGTMCLTEPQCGTDLGLLTTKAEPEGDHYLLTGTKIWITFGEHDMADNIVHLVLARLPDAPEGIKGISLFIVPKFDLDGTRNPIYCTGLEHKMGIKASPTCVMSLEGAKGWLVGEPNKGMRGMFTMMNAARLLVGLEGVAMGEVAYQTALEYAKDRRQGRALDASKREEGVSADNIMVHPDVRRMFMNIKSTHEAMRGLAYWTGIRLDMAHNHPDEKVRQRADDLVALLTPVIKSFLTEVGFDNISEALQICGGAGYTTDWSLEQHMRDARIALIYEGTNGIQALDLVGRKLPRGGGRLLMRFSKEITRFIEANKDDEAMAEFIKPLKEGLELVSNLTMSVLMQRGMQDPEEAAAVASPYLKLFGYVSLGFIWNLMVKHAQEQGDAFGQTKVKTARYFFSNVYPEIHGLAKLVEAGKANVMALDVDEF